MQYKLKAASRTKYGTNLSGNAGFLAVTPCYGDQQVVHPWQEPVAHKTPLHELEVGGLGIGHKSTQSNISQERPSAQTRSKLLEDGSGNAICPSPEIRLNGPTMDSIFDELSVDEYTSATQYLVGSRLCLAPMRVE